MKKMLALLCAVTMMAALLAGCGGSSTAPATTAAGGDTTKAEESAKPDESAAPSGEQMSDKYNIGFVTLSTAGSFFGNVYGIVNEVCELTGAELVSDVGAISPEDQVTSVQNVISGGADMVVFINFTEDCLPKIGDLCEKNQVYWGQYARNVDNPEIREYLDKCEYYVGRVYNDDSFIAKQALEKFKEEGVTKVGIVGPATGDTATDLRDSYFQEHASE